MDADPPASDADAPAPEDPPVSDGSASTDESASDPGASSGSEPSTAAEGDATPDTTTSSAAEGDSDSTGETTTSADGADSTPESTGDSNSDSDSAGDSDEGSTSDSSDSDSDGEQESDDGDDGDDGEQESDDGDDDGDGDDPADSTVAAATNLQWQQADGTSIATASPSDSVTASFDLSHDDDNQVNVVVLASDQSTQVGAPVAMERQDQSGFTAPWVVPASGDGFYFQVTVSNDGQSGSPALSDELTLAPAPTPLLDHYYPPDEKPSLDYVVLAEPPPADSGQVLYHQGSQTGPVIDQGDLATAGTGHLEVDLTNRQAAQDSPLFLEFVYKKAGHDDQRAFRAMSLADPAPATIEAPATAKPGDSVTLEVTAWNAVVYDTQGTGTARAESDLSRISDADKAAVKWKVGDTELPDQGEQVDYTIPADATGTLVVEAWLERSSSFPAGATIQLAGTGCHFKLVWKDPAGTEHPFPIGFPFKADFGHHHTQDVTVAASGALDFTPPDGATSVILRHDHGAEIRYIASATDGTTGDDAEKWIVAADVPALIGQSFTVWRVAPTWSLAQTSLAVDGTQAWDGSKFTLDATQAIATPSAPAKITIDLHWQFFAFRFWDRKNAALALVPPLVCEGFLEASASSGAPDTASNWTTGSGYQAMPWLIQATATGTAQAKPDEKVLLRFRTAPATYVDTSSGGPTLATKTPVSPQTDPALNQGAALAADPAVPGVARLALYDLPPVWKSAGYWGHLLQEDASAKQGKFEDLAKDPTTDSRPLIFCLDDIVLAKPDSHHRLVALTHHEWDPAADPAAIFANTFLRTGTSSEDDVGPFRSDHAHWRSFFSAGVSNLSDASPRNYIADHPDWGFTRLVIAKGNCFDVFDQRTSDLPNQVVGARAAVRWVDAVSILAQGHQQDPRTTHPENPTPFFSIIPFHEQRQWDWVAAPNAHRQLGRYDLVMLRCCGADPFDATTEVGVVMSLCRFHVEMSPSWKVFGGFATNLNKGLGTANHAWANGTQAHDWWANVTLTGMSDTGTYTNTLPAGIEFMDADELAELQQAAATAQANGGTIAAKIQSLINHQPFRATGVAPRWSGPDQSAGGTFMNLGSTFIQPQDPAKKFKLRSIWFAMHLPRSQAAMELGVFHDQRSVDDGHGHHHHRYAWVRAYCQSSDGTLPNDRADVVPEQDGNGGFAEGDSTIVHETGHMCGNIDEYAESGIAGLYGFSCYSPGSPFIFDDRSIMKADQEPRCRQRWAEAEACAQVYGTDMQVYHDQGIMPAYVFKLPHFDPAVLSGYNIPHATSLRFNFVNWPLSQQQNVAIGTHGQANLFFYPLGQDPYSHDVLPTRIGKPGELDGILKILLNVAVLLDNGVAAANQSSVISQIDTAFSASPLYFVASGNYGGRAYARVLVALDIRYAQTATGSHVTLASVATAAAQAGSPYTGGSTWDAHHPRRFVWSRNPQAGPPIVDATNTADLGIMIREVLGLPAVQVSGADDAAKIQPLVQQVFPGAAVAQP